MKRLQIILLLSISAVALQGQSAKTIDFIDRYKEIAIKEMHRTGIPASIKLAQGILESESGSSELALHSNNFFGLKCGPSWEGGTYYKKDDDRDRRGRLIKSCFRTFFNPEESFIEHSSFLMHPKKAYRYGFLFNIDRTDYKSWAWGLKESGYATNPRYANLLISLIEKYELYSYDYYEPELSVVMVHNPGPKSKPTYKQSTIEPRTIITSQWKKKLRHEDVIDGVIKNNGLRLVYARRYDTPLQIAERYHQSLKNILSYNERLKSADQPIALAERVYLDKKKRSYRGNKKKHVVSEGEGMYDIAQRYGILLQKLYVRNRMHPGTEPAIGEEIVLRGMVKSKHRPRLRTDRKRYELPIQYKPGKKEEIRYIVEQGDTLYRIASRYQVTLESLKSRNDLESNVIKPGQILFIGS